MGIEGVFRYLEDEKVETAPADKALIRTADIDVLSVFFSYIRSTHQRLKYQSFRSTAQPTTPGSTDTVMTRLIHALHNKLRGTFDKDEVTLHFDGLPTTQKSKARERRRAKCDQDIRSMYDQAQKLQEMINCNNYSRSQKRKIARSLRKVKSSWASARVIDKDTKDGLTSGLRDLGWRVCCCEGEADVCIGRRARQHPGELVAVSADSDILFHGVRTLYRWDSCRRVFTTYDVCELIKKLGVTEAQWVVAAIVTSNDYSTHIRGQSFRKNLALLRDCDADDEQGVLDQYCRMMSVRRDMFEPSTQVFIDKVETTMDDQKSNGDIDQTMKDLASRVTQYFQEFKAANKEGVLKGVSESGAAGAEIACQEGMVIVEEAMSKSEAIKSDPRNAKRRPSARSYRTSGHDYRAKEFHEPAIDLNRDDATASRSTKKRKRRANSKGKKKKAKVSKEKRHKSKVLRTPASRRARQQEEENKDSDTIKKGRKRNPGNMIGDVLNSNFATVTMNMGTIRHRLQNGLEQNYQANNHLKLSQHIESTIEGLVKINTDLIRCGSLATLNYINEIMAAHPSIDPASGDVEIRCKLFKYIAGESHGFFKTLVKGLYHWNNDLKGKGESFDSASAAIRSLREMPGDKNAMMQRVMEHLNGAAPSTFLEQTGQVLGDMARCHFRAFIPELQKRIAVWNPEWAMTPEGHGFLSTIDSKGKSSVHDVVSLFWILNTRLPVSKRLVYVPMPAFKDNYCLISERQLLDAVLRTRGTDQDVRKELTRILGGSAEAKDNSQAYPGELFRKLFFHGKKTN